MLTFFKGQGELFKDRQKKYAQIRSAFTPYCKKSVANCKLSLVGSLSHSSASIVFTLFLADSSSLMICQKNKSHQQQHFGNTSVGDSVPGTSMIVP